LDENSRNHDIEAIEDGIERRAFLSILKVRKAAMDVTVATTIGQ